VALDWTEFDKDNQSTLALHLLTAHGRSTAVMWKTVLKSELQGQRNAIEDELLYDFHALVGDSVKVTVLADRGFGDANLYTYQNSLGFDYIIRFKGNIQVTTSSGESRPAKEWLSPSGRARMLRNVQVTGRKIPIAAMVCVWAKGMKEPWFLACGAHSATCSASAVVKRYGKRFRIEERFRDEKDIRFGLGLSSATIKNPLRRDRILILSAIACSLLTLLGAAGENIGHDRLLKANTSKQRTHSLFTQGVYYYGAIPNMREAKLRVLMTEFARLIQQHEAFSMLFGVL
jgi:hypothetical protein